MVKLYYSTYICQLWSGDSNQISEKAIKGLTLKINIIVNILKLKIVSKIGPESKDFDNIDLILRKAQGPSSLNENLNRLHD